MNDEFGDDRTQFNRGHPQHQQQKNSRLSIIPRGEKNKKRIFQLLAIAGAVILWILSIVFSASGLNFATGNRWALVVGVALGLVITILQVVFLQEGLEHRRISLIILGVFAFGYGIWSNINGLAEFSGVTSVITGILETPEKMIFPVLIGILIEIGAEPLLLWGWVDSEFRSWVDKVL